MTRRKREDGLSELIGFILLLALAVTIASLYLTYGVPANGREDEIAHMDYIKQQFLDYKIALDSLWINNAQDVPMTQSITLGTQGVKTSGMFGGFNLFRPVFSGGTIMVRNYEPSEKLVTSITKPLYSSAYAKNHGSDYVMNQTYNETFFPSSPVILNETPSHLYINFSTNEITQQNDPIKLSYSNFPIDYGVNISSTTPSDYSITLKAKIKNVTTDFNWTTLKDHPTNSSDVYWVRYLTDLVLTISKKGINVLDNYPVYTNINNKTNYTIDLLDPAYGLSQHEGIFKGFSSSNITGIKNFLVSYSAKSGYINASSLPTDSIIIYPYNSDGTTSSVPLLGRLEYQSHNNYYQTQENFVYQMGGIYVNQTEGSTPLNFPLISIVKSSSKYWNVSITDMILNGDTSISGSSPVQISTRLKSISGCGLEMSQPNVASVTISIQNTNQVDLWKTIFTAIVQNAGLSIDGLNVILSDDNLNIVNLTINGPNTDTTTRDIWLNENFIDYSVELDPVGQSIGI